VTLSSYKPSLGFIEPEFYREKRGAKDLLNDLFNEIGRKEELLEISETFKSDTAKLIQLNFYKLKLYKIDIFTMAVFDIMYKALLEQYGLSQEVYADPGKHSWKVYEWRDKETTIGTCNCQYFEPNRRTYNTLFYIDNALYTLVRQAAIAEKKALEEEEKRRQHTLPK